MQALAGVADLFEVRADHVRDLDLPSLLAARTKPILLTCRPESEGGRFPDRDREARRSLLREAVARGFDLVAPPTEFPPPPEAEPALTDVSLQALAAPALPFEAPTLRPEPEAPNTDAAPLGNLLGEALEHALRASDAALEHAVRASGELAAQPQNVAEVEARAPSALEACADSDPLPSAEPESTEPEHASIWREALENADGAQSWENLERLYVGNYLPLAHLASDGRASRKSRERLKTWAEDFAHCYRSAFTRLRSGGPRPTMVLDVPQLAFGLMRELEATQIRLILVDGMRFDLGQRVHDKLRLQLLGHANCVQRRVLWAALPGSTAVQLELLARGACALGRTLGDLDERAWQARGAEARKLRALRVGPHQIRKLDILEAEFGRSQWVPSELERAAAEVAVSTGRFIRAQSPGTLVVVFGDHGLADPHAMHEASPEQVLVPYDAWLVHDSANN